MINYLNEFNFSTTCGWFYEPTCYHNQFEWIHIDHLNYNFFFFTKVKWWFIVILLWCISVIYYATFLVPNNFPKHVNIAMSDIKIKMIQHLKGEQLFNTDGIHKNEYFSTKWTCGRANVYECIYLHSYV